MSHRSLVKFVIIITVLLLSIGPFQLTAASNRGSKRNEPPEFDSEPMDERSPTAAASSAAAASFQCEPITIKLCSQMAYQSTRMPNFFKDSNQIEAVDRALQYQELVNTRCSAHIHAYICELLTPVCLEDSREAMKRFEIYPCRSFCRRVKRDCEEQLFRLNERLFSQGSSSLLPGFACEMLPFESNGGNGTLRGPCHETPEPPTNQQQLDNNKASYSPYQPSLDSNIPPFITDTSRIDPGLIKQPNSPSLSWPDHQADNQASMGNSNGRPKQAVSVNNNPPQSGTVDQIDNSKPPNSNKQATFLNQMQTFGQNVLWLLIRYSNVLSIATVLCLLAALNAKRLRRLKTYLSLSPSSSTKSSTTSGVHHHHHHGGGKIIPGAYPAIGGLGHHHKSSLSPSSSSRSLMLIAGSNKQPPTHKLLSADPSDPSQKLLHGLQQKTLINVNGTLERQQHSNNNRYLIMGQPPGAASDLRGQQHQVFKQHSDKQQLFNTLDSHSSSNQYDYIQVMSDQSAAGDGQSYTNFNSQFKEQQQPSPSQQLYSNILLTSPSHQVLLMGNNGYQTELGGNQNCRQNNPNRSMQQPRSQPPQQQPPAVGSRHAPYFSASLTGPYAAPTGCGVRSMGGGSLIGDSPHNQRSFQRRTSSSNKAASGRFLNPQQDLSHQQQAGGRKRAEFSANNRAGYTSASSGSSSSSSSVISPPISDLTTTNPPSLLGPGGSSRRVG